MKCGFASSVRSSNQRSHNKGGGECPRLKVSAERIIFVDDDHVAVKVVGGNDGELVADPDDHRCDHQGFGEAERSEEHTSELQSLMRSSYAVFCLKKKKHQKQNKNNQTK